VKDNLNVVNQRIPSTADQLRMVEEALNGWGLGGDQSQSSQDHTRNLERPCGL